MKHHEELVAAWLSSKGHAIRHMADGEDPPDLVVDGNIAVEVTTIASYAFNTLWSFMEGVCKSVGPAEGGRGYWLAISADNDALLQDNDKGTVAAIKRDLRRAAKAELRNHYATSVARTAEHATGPFERRDRFALPHGVELCILGRINDNRDSLKYKVGAGGESGGGLVVPDLIGSIQSVICKKTAKSSIQERKRRYAAWWLAVTDPHRHAASLYDDEIRTVASAIQYGALWRRVLLVDLASDKVSRVVDLTEARA